MAVLTAPLPDGPIGYLKDAKTGQWLAVTLDTDAWDPYFRGLARTVEATPERLKAVFLQAKSAAIGATSVPLPSLATGLYRVTYSLQQVQVATTSLVMTVTIAWTRNGAAQSQAGAAVNGNTLTTQQNGSLLVRVTAGTPITYAVSYASVGATVGKFDFDVVVESIPT